MELIGSTKSAHSVEFKEGTDYTSSFSNFGAGPNVLQEVDERLVQVALNPTVCMTY